MIDTSTAENIWGFKLVFWSLKFKDKRMKKKYSGLLSQDQVYQKF